MELNAQEKVELLEIARRSIEAEVRGVFYSHLPTRHSKLNEKSGVFVTLRIDNELRGCIGYVEAKVPLLRGVHEVAVKAACEDPRFMPLTAKELDQVEIEISVLSPLQPMDEIEDIVIGKHGLVVDAGDRRGLLLPHVATEFSWNREQFLEHTCAKAGLPPTSWKRSDVNVFIFRTDTFSEKDLREENN